VPLLERPEVDPSGSTAFAVSTSGTLAYIPRESTLPSRALVLVDRTGRPTVLSEKPDAFAHPRLSPDGHRLAVAIESDNGSDIWIYDVDHGTPTPLVTGGVNRFPIWSADGQQITFQSARLGGVSLYSQRVNGTFEPEALIRSTSDQSQSLSRALAGLLPGTMPIFTNANPHLPMSWARDGLTLAFEERKPGADHDIWVLTRGSEPWAFQRTENDESSPVFSPDGKWLAYVSDESGRRSVWVQPFPGPGAKWLVSPDGGTEPAWSRDGTTLFFRRANQLVSVPITPGAEFRWGRPQRVLEFRYATLAGARNYDVSPDNTFVVVRSEGAADADQFNVVLNWFAELRSRK
jgi:serine/threonine-protein kinase